MEMAELQSLYTQILWAAFAVSAVFGWIAQRTHFCTMGAISDIVNMGDWTRMRMWGMAVGVAMLAFHAMAWQGWIDPTQTIYASGRVMWLSNALGGVLFGFGMVLASGCGSKTLVRIGGGNLKSLVVFFVLGFAAFATMRGITAVLRVNTVDQVAFDMSPGSALPAWFAVPTLKSRSITPLAVITAPRGRRVLPEVNCKKQRSSGVTFGGLNAGASPWNASSATRMTTSLVSGRSLSCLTSRLRL